MTTAQGLLIIERELFDAQRRPRSTQLEVFGTIAAVDAHVAELLKAGWTRSGETVRHKRGVKEVRLVRAVQEAA